MACPEPLTGRETRKISSGLNFVRKVGPSSQHLKLVSTPVCRGWSWSPHLKVSAFPQQQRRTMAQGSLSFRDVAVGFTQKEWQQLDLERRTLYRM
ncbi:zinc finger protein 585B-like [Chlorocebus sabaeus]|uniref:zinc finger protein 585B-like n=1 Tax=Chlorocebus sabaeus TaxID=60711 RepID=UPI003BFA3920